MKIRLTEEKARVDKKIADLTRPEKPLDNPDWDDTATDAIQDIEQESLLRVYRGLQERVDNALKRIEDGTYGKCHECDAEILAENLEKEPWAMHCGAICAKKHNEGN